MPSCVRCVDGLTGGWLLEEVPVRGFQCLEEGAHPAGLEHVLVGPGLEHCGGGGAVLPTGEDHDVQLGADGLRGGRDVGAAPTAC